MTRRRVFWNVTEQHLVVKTAADLLRRFPRMPVFRAVAEAQLSLPPERQRKVENKGVLGVLTKQIEIELNRPVQSALAFEPSESENSNPLDAAIANAARSVAQKFENELKAAMSKAAQRVANQAAEGKL